MPKIKEIIKRETVLCAAVVLAVISAFFVAPGPEYLSYIDFRVLAILLSLMIVMEGCKNSGIFSYVGEKLLSRCSSLRALAGTLIFLCFFSSMLITNDVALITFVPFAILTMKAAGLEKYLIPVIVFQTVAANLGSMLTPIGNPQNLYLYNLMGSGLIEFVMIMLPYCVVSLILLVISLLVFPRVKLATITKEKTDADRPKSNDITLYLLLFIVCLGVVARLIPYYIALIVVIAVMILFRKRVLLSVDYGLLVTFIAFFIFIGNMGRIPSISQLLKSCIAGNEIILGTGVSQLVSNVPAALLLSAFTTDIKSLLIGVNLGGLGTLIASMASLISYKIYAHSYNDSKGKYLLYFTVINIVYLAVLLGVCYILSII